MYVPSLFVDYRHFDAANIKPRFEFGFGLSYTKFDYSGLSISVVAGGQDQDTELEADWLAGKPGPHGVGASTALWLHRPAYIISFTVQNMGTVAGTEVRELFIVRPSVLTHADKTNTGFPAVPALPRAGRRAAIGPARIHGRGSAAGRIENGLYHALQIRLVDMGCHRPVVDACRGDILPIGRSEQSGSQVKGKAAPVNQPMVILWGDLRVH